MPKRREFWRVVRGLRKRFPLPFPVRVRFKSMPDNWGNADLIGDDDNRYFVINIDSSLNESLATHFLCHEYAHCLRWDYRHDLGDEKWPAHDGAMGVHWAEVFRFVFDGE